MRHSNDEQPGTRHMARARRTGDEVADRTARR